MGSSTENQVAGKIHEAKGVIKEKVGRVTNDPNLEVEGHGEENGWEDPKQDWPCTKSRRKVLSLRRSFHHEMCSGR